MAPRQAHPFVRAGVPLLGLTIGGFAALQFFIQGRIDVQVGGWLLHERLVARQTGVGVLLQGASGSATEGGSGCSRGWQILLQPSAPCSRGEWRPCRTPPRTADQHIERFACARLPRPYYCMRTKISRSLPCHVTALQDAQRKELDLRAPVSKQRAKKFNLEEELAVSRGHSLITVIHSTAGAPTQARAAGGRTPAWCWRHAGSTLLPAPHLCSD